MVLRAFYKIYKYFSKFGIKGILAYFRIKLGSQISISLPGIKHPIKLRNGTSDPSTFEQIFIDGEYELELDFEPETIIDAGANIGLAAIYFANKYPQACIISIEPENSNYELLEANIEEYDNITALKRALSSESKQEVVVNDPGLGNWGFMTGPKDDSSRESIKNTVNTITINDIIQEHGFDRIDIAKIDIEGGEKDLFMSGADDWLPKTKCLVIELHDRMKPGCSASLFRAICNYDFSLSIRGENLVFVNNNIK